MFTPRKVHLTTLALIVWFVSASPPLGAQGVAEPGVKHQGRLKTPPGTAEDEKEAITRYVAAQDGGVAAIGPRLITYQGLIENVGGPIDNQSMVVEFRAWNALEGGNPRAVAVSKTLSASQLRRGVFSVEMDADQLALPDNADDTYLEVAVCSPAPCSPVALTPRQHLTAAALAVSARSLGGAARAEADGSLVVESATAASGVMSLKSLGATESMSLSAAGRSLSMFPASGTGSLALRAMSPNGDSTEAFLDDALGEMSLSKVTLAAEESTAALTAKKLLFKPADGSVAAFRASVAAPLKLSSRSPTGETNLLLDDAFGRVSISRVESAANTAGLTPPPKLILDPRAGTFAAAVDSGSATMTLMSTSASGNTTQLLLDDAVGKVTISKEVVALNTAVASSKKLVIDAANGSVAAFDGNNAAAVRFKTGDTLAMEIDPTTNTVTAFGAGGFKANKVLIDSGIASNTAGPSAVVELVTTVDAANIAGPGATRMELKVDGQRVDSWSGLGASPYGSSPNRIGGAPSNSVAAGRFGATVSGGGTSVQPNVVNGDFATVSGGINNCADGLFSKVGGGIGNRATGDWSTLGGGFSNIASGLYSTLGGGSNNNPSGELSTVSGGYNNIPSGYASTVGGGSRNVVIGSYSTVPGGSLNYAEGDYSFASGRQAKANHNGTFVWADSTDAEFASNGQNQFIVRASGGIHLGTDSTVSIPAGRFLNTSTGGYLTTGGVWTDSSDRNVKENFDPLDGHVVLDRLSEVPITRWNFKVQDASVQHIGPTAQDFHTAFGTGEDDKHLAALDTAGVALAAIQGLYDIVQVKDCEINELRSEIEDLKEIVNALSKQNGGGR